MLDQPAQSGPQDAQVLLAVNRGKALLQDAGALAVTLGQINLPSLPDPPLSSPADQSVLRAVAPLYLAMELEIAGLTRALSAAAGLYMSGALRIDPGEVAETLLNHHRHYERRMPSQDRYAAYLRLFGTALSDALPFAVENSINAGFDEVMLRLAEAMHRFANLSPRELNAVAAQREIRAAARAVGESLVMRGGGTSHYLAEDAMTLLAIATDVFKNPQVQAAFGVRDFWSAVYAALNLSTGTRIVPSVARNHLERGKAGMLLVEWIAQRASDIHGMGRLNIQRDDPILAQGTVWLEATFSLLSQRVSYD